MKIAIRGGHSLDIRGAIGFVDEVTEDRKIYAKVRDYLIQAGHQVLDVTPGNSGSSSQDLSIAVSKANEWDADYFASIHLNASNGQGHGTEVLFRSAEGKEYADRIARNIASLGFSNRGSKSDTRGLYEFNHAVMPNNIIEVFFCDNKQDVELYTTIGQNSIAKAIAEGILNQTIPITLVSNAQDNPQINYNPQPDKAAIAQTELYEKISRGKKYVGNRCSELQSKLNIVMNLKLAVDGDFGGKTYGALIAFQQKYGLVVDGCAGINTFNKLDNLISTINKTQNKGSNPRVLAYQKACNQAGVTDSENHKLAEDGVIGSHTLSTLNKIVVVKKGDNGEFVKWIQGIVGCTQDGIFGSITETKVRQYQSAHELEVDGKCGKQTLTFMLNHC